ncbi:MAG TPA: histidine phosphatase family protein [Pirellulales bacterium]|jgi:broad specificity phosphatase PhoE|nr:histidine phosphatase family protein [Pirellulales bacterium]
MSLLTLVRHAQASFFADDYDQLSELGQRQARLLAEHWIRRGVTCDELHVGPRRRQRETAEIMTQAFGEAGRSWPAPLLVEDFDEYDLAGLLRVLADDLARRDAAYAALVRRHVESQDDPDRLRTFQAQFEALLTHWIDRSDELAGVESWPAFYGRVQRALRSVCERAGSGRHVVAITSGGFIAAAVSRALAAPPRTALELNWRLRNTALTQFMFTAERFTLDSFNCLPHLDDPSLWTYR